MHGIWDFAYPPGKTHEDNIQLLFILAGPIVGSLSDRSVNHSIMHAFIPCMPLAVSWRYGSHLKEHKLDRSVVSSKCHEVVYWLGLHLGIEVFDES